MDLFDELAGLVAALDRAEIDYALVGALALAVHGAPRATADIDLLIRESSVDPLLELAKPLGFRFGAMPMRFPDLLEIRRATKLVDGQALTLDLLLLNPNLQEIWESRMPMDTEFGPLQVISRSALIQMKIWSGRPQDLADVARLEEMDR